MKNFLCTVPGKTILFMLTIIFAAMFLVSVLAAVVMTDADFYTLTEREIIQNMTDKGVLPELAEFMFKLRYIVYFIAPGALIAGIVSFVALMCAVARRPGSEEIYPGPLCRLPADVLLAGVMILLFSTFLVCYNVRIIDDFVQLILIFVFIILTSIILLGACVSFAGMAKSGVLIKNTITWRCLRLLWRLIKWIFYVLASIPLVWRTALIVFIVSFAELIALSGTHYRNIGLVISLWFIEKLILVPVILYISIALRKLQKGGEALASGDLNAAVDTKFLLWDFKRHGNNLNSIGVGMTKAIEQRMKSERMKTELITNVSHDIKTPLTSIINYSDLIMKEECDNPKIIEYSEVLHRQSQRLRRLTDDLVEASKASSGAMDVTLTPCEVGTILLQAAAEYEERLAMNDLSLVTTLPEETVTILADGAKLWRVLDNIMSNACKYSLPGTRIYLTLEKTDKTAVITLKNISSKPLNITAEELIERFVRGDASRNTEGNGLGLSIAKSLTELQKGYLGVTIDGDLFKVTIKFRAE
ncbi:MAG: sensor histidine kinase [Clostridiales bacterium]|nr:sensor histidine kinase [Clostridiales bacterium]